MRSLNSEKKNVFHESGFKLLRFEPKIEDQVLIISLLTVAAQVKITETGTKISKGFDESQLKVVRYDFRFSL